MPAFNDITGQRFGRLVVLSRAENKGKDVTWDCSCDCGNVHNTRGSDLRRGSIKSCGCLRREVSTEKATTHGLSAHPLYTVWASMMARCYNTKNNNYYKYGAKGITVCDDWQDLPVFASDMGDKPEGRYSIDRVDNDGDYEPNNCRWATDFEQSRNTSRNVMYTVGEQTLCLEDWAAKVGMYAWTLSKRLKRGLDIEQALNRRNSLKNRRAR